MGVPAITGFSSTYRRPIFAALIQFAQGAVSANLGLRCLVAGMMTAAGTMTADVAPIQCISVDDAHAKGGIGSEVALMAEAALLTGADVWMVATTPPSGGTAATVTSVISGTLTSNGTVVIKLAGKSFSIDVLSTDAIDTIGAAIVTKMNADTKLPFTFAYNTGTDTLTATCKYKGARGKDWIFELDLTAAPTGLAMTWVGSAAVTGGTRVRAGASSSGTGVDDVTTLLTNLVGTRWGRIAAAQADATQAQQWEDFVNAEDDATKIRLNHVIFGHNGTSAAAITLGQTNLNAFRAQLLACRNCPSHPSIIAASNAGKRAVTEVDTWVPDYDCGYGDSKLLGVAPQGYDTDKWTDVEEETLLHGGVTPVRTTDGKAHIVRAITTYCLNTATTTEDDRCLDIGDAVCPDNATLDLQAAYTSFREVNHLVGPDPAPGAPPPPSGVAYPALWNSEIQVRQKAWFDAGWIEAPSLVDGTLPQSSYNATARRIESLNPIVVRRVQHQLAVTTRQQAPAA